MFAKIVVILPLTSFFKVIHLSFIIQKRQDMGRKVKKPADPILEYN